MSKYPDLSDYTPVNNWDEVKRNCPFLISKATQGTDFVDTSLDQFIRECEERQIPYWLYTYLDEGNELAQAEFLVAVCRKKVGPYFVGYILDIEDGNPEENVRAALGYLEKMERKAMLYTMYAQYDKYKKVIVERGEQTAWWESRYGLNEGTYNNKYPCHKGADLQQFTSRGVCEGIAVKCDLNRLTGRIPEIWFASPKPEALPAQPRPSYTRGSVYVTSTKLNVRKGPGTEYGKVGYEGLTADAKKHDRDRDGAIDKGTRVTCLEIFEIGRNIWIRIPSGWIAAYYNGKRYVR